LLSAAVAFGCPAIQPPTNSRAEREPGDDEEGGEGQLVIRCLHSDQVYRLRCTGSSWVGQVGSCDSPLVNNQGVSIFIFGQHVASMYIHKRLGLPVRDTRKFEKHCPKVKL